MTLINLKKSTSTASFKCFHHKMNILLKGLTDEYLLNVIITQSSHDSLTITLEDLNHLRKWKMIVTLSIYYTSD